MSGITLHVTEHAVGNKLVRQAYATKKGAFDAARERVTDADVATVAVWVYTSDLDARGALMETIAGREWFDERKLVAVVAKKEVRVTK